jgi:hypothetical protein
MKSRYLLIPLVLCSCSGSIIKNDTNGKVEKYTNVYYEFIRDDNYYHVGIINDNDFTLFDKEWKVDPKNVFYVFYNDYLLDDRNGIIYNEYYVSGNSYKLFVYKYSR